MGGRRIAPREPDPRVRSALGELNTLSERLSLPATVTDEAARICVRGLEEARVHRRPLARIPASSLYAACRESVDPTTLDDVAAASRVQRKEIARCYRLLVNELDLKIPVAGPTECLERVALRAKVSPKVEADARALLSRAAKAGITAGVNPSGLAASALYLASLLDQEWMTQARAADAAGVEEPTVRREYKLLRKVLKVRLGGTPLMRKRVRSQLEAERSTSAGVPLNPFPSRI